MRARLIPYVDQVRSALGIEQELREPPMARRLENGRVEGACIPALRFPSWMRCPECGLLHFKPWRGLKAGEKPRCMALDKRKCTKRPLLEQVAWVLVHPDGHLADVPWHDLAHKEARRRAKGKCHSDWKTNYLRLIEKMSGERILFCERCGATRDFSDNLQMKFGQRRPQPWIWYDHPEPIAGDAEVMAVNDVRVHFPNRCSALVIPPESRIRKGTVVDRLYRSSKKRQRIDDARTPLAKKGVFRTLASEFRCTAESVEDAWREIKNGYPRYGREMTPGLLLESEYKAFLEELPDVLDDEDFIPRHHTADWRAFAKDLSDRPEIYAMARSISRLIAVERLKVIEVFRGFRRVAVDAPLVPPDIVGKSTWLPAMEFYGEGIFFTLNERALQRWERHPELILRAGVFKKRYEGAGGPANVEDVSGDTAVFVDAHPGASSDSSTGIFGRVSGRFAHGTDLLPGRRGPHGRYFDICG